MNEQADDNCIEIKVVKSITDEDTKKMIQKYANIKMPTELQNMERTRRDEIIRKIKEVEGVSTRQIARVTGMSQTVISKA
jgi:putative transposase